MRGSPLKKILLSTAALVALSCGAIAADMPSTTAPASPYGGLEAKNPFHGFYLGVHGGYAGGKMTGNWAPAGDIPFVPFSYRQHGALIGAQAGLNYVRNSGLLIGAEVSASWANVHGGDTLGVGIDSSYNANIDSIGIAQAKLGWANSNLALYATGGFALAHSTFRAPVVITPGIGTEFTSNWTRVGWTVGAGLDYMLMKNVSLGMSYNYVDLRKFNDTATANVIIPIMITTTPHPTMNIGKANINYHF